MKVLLYEDNVPKSAGSGGHVATFGLIDFLRERCDLSIVNIVSNPNLDPYDGPGVTVWHRKEMGGLVSRAVGLLSTQAKMVAEIDWTGLESKVAGQYDRIIYGSARFLELAVSAQARTYYIADNVEWELALAMESNYRSHALAKLDADRIKRLEARGISAVTRAAAFTNRDAESLSALAGRPVKVIPPILPPANRTCVPREPFALYATNLNHPPNRDALSWLLDEAWPCRSRPWPLVVTGAGDFSPFVDRFPEIDFKGFVSRDELSGLYDRAAVALNPTRTGSGFQIKLLEALSYGCPVVSTDFSNPLGSVIPSSDDPGQFAALVDSALSAVVPAPFDYETFYKRTCRQMADFLELSDAQDH